MSTRSSIAYHHCESQTYHLFYDVMYEHYGLEVLSPSVDMRLVVPKEFVYALRDTIAAAIPGPEHPSRKISNGPEGKVEVPERHCSAD